MGKACVLALTASRSPLFSLLFLRRSSLGTVWPVRECEGLSGWGPLRLRYGLTTNPATLAMAVCFSSKVRKVSQPSSRAAAT